jgi:hypothetical protein
MKKISLLLLLSFFIALPFVKADPWTGMTEAEAKETMAYLQKNPYLFDYCDCCDEVAREYDGKKLMGHLVKIVKMEIVTCEWDETLFSVNIVQTEVLASGYVENGVFGMKAASAEELASYTDSWPVALNYSFTLTAGKAVRLFTKTSYEAEDVGCGAVKAFPDPKTLENNKLTKAYAKYYKKNG